MTIKPILISEVQGLFPDLSFIGYDRNCYTFQRIKPLRGHQVYQNIHISVSVKNGNFVCSIASRLNKSEVNSNQYNTGLINPHIDLITLKRGSGIMPFKEAAYYFDNTSNESLLATIRLILADYHEFGTSFWNSQYTLLSENKIIQSGLDYISALSIDKLLLKAEIDNQLSQAKHMISSLKHPLYIDLKEFLQNINDQTRENRKEIPRLALELLELYCLAE